MSAPGRFEYRSVDSAVNPYLSMASLLVAMRDGLDQSIDPGPPEDGNIYEAIEAGKEVTRIPNTLGGSDDARSGRASFAKRCLTTVHRMFMH